MGRKYVDCRDFPESHCSVALSADTEDELVEAAVEHAVKTHGEHDTPELRSHIRQMTREGGPPA